MERDDVAKEKVWKKTRETRFNSVFIHLHSWTYDGLLLLQWLPENIRIVSVNAY